ncbi:DUF1822 family protein [Pantanalinema sp. GBBB05]|uniref:DUF1822 family protein n=1 Tax=Pantanalinema sp. GBBB05 TaxID=2604139 RepID=UPI003D8163B4
MVIFADPKEWWLEVSPSMQAEAVQQSQLCRSIASRQRAYLNALCLQAVLEWIRADVTAAAPWLTSLLPAIWDVVNGTTMMLGAIRLVLLPTDAIDASELEVPQEWVDCPSWAGDYYLAAQVNPEASWVRVWGYTTHQELKAIGHYDSIDRTYSLAAEQLTLDLNAFWATYQLCGTAQTRQAIAPLPELSDMQADHLIQRLGDPAIVFPRLAVPFSLWGALLSRSGWLQALYLQRCGIERTRPAIVRLSDWLQGQFTEVWQTVDAVLPTQVVMAWRSSESGSEDVPVYAINRAKVLALAPTEGKDGFALLIGITPIDSTQMNLGLHVCPVGQQATFLPEIRVRLLDGAGTEVGQASATMPETIQFQFSGQVGEQFSVEVAMGDRTLTEFFEV